MSLAKRKSDAGVSAIKTEVYSRRRLALAQKIWYANCFSQLIATLGTIREAFNKGLFNLGAGNWEKACGSFNYILSFTNSVEITLFNAVI